jgi:RNA polymerase sigma-70 factor (ECF subfamily)
MNTIKITSEKFDLLFNEYYTNLCRFALTYVDDQSVAEEIVQEVFIYLWEKKENIEIKSSVRSYLYMATKHAALRFKKAGTIRRKHEDNYAQKKEYTEEQDAFDEKELTEMLNSAIDRLPEKCKAIFKLKYNEKLSYKEIAEKLNISPKTVDNQIGIAIKKITEILRPYLNTSSAIALIWILKNFK